MNLWKENRSKETTAIIQFEGDEVLGRSDSGARRKKINARDSTKKDMDKVVTRCGRERQDKLTCNSVWELVSFTKYTELVGNHT